MKRNHSFELRRKTTYIIRFEICSKITEEVRNVVQEEVFFNIDSVTYPIKSQILLAVWEGRKCE